MIDHPPLPRLSSQLPYWNKVAWQKEFTQPLDAELFESLIPRTARVLDVGCGYGRLTSELSRRGYRHVTGVDASPEMVRRGRELHPGIDLRTIDGGDGAVLPFWEGAFDAVLVFSVLTCLPSEEDLSNLIEEVARVLAPGGIVFVGDFVIQDDDEHHERYSGGERRYGVRGVFDLPEGVVLRHFREDELEKLLGRFEPLRRTIVDVPTMNGHRARGFQFVGRTRGV